MNFYQHHLGDYAKDTGHLSLLEHGVLRTLLDWQYSSERPLPAEISTLHRICRAFSRLERDTTTRIRNEFFDGDGWNKRAREEIEFCLDISAERRRAAVKKHHPDWTDEQVQTWCNEHANAPRKQSKCSATRARSNSQQPTANSIEGGAARCQVDDLEILRWAAEWPGELASGTPRMPVEWVKVALAKLNGRNTWPANWTKWLISVWRAEHRTFSGGDGGENFKKNAAGGMSANVAEIARQKKMRALSEEEDALAYDVHALRQSNIEVPAEKVQRLDQVRAEIKKIRDGAGGGSTN